VRHFCMSPLIAQPLVDAGASRIAIASRPDEATLVELVDASQA